MPRLVDALVDDEQELLAEVQRRLEGRAVRLAWAMLAVKASATRQVARKVVTVGSSIWVF